MFQVKLFWIQHTWWATTDIMLYLAYKSCIQFWSNRNFHLECLAWTLSVNLRLGRHLKSGRSGWYGSSWVVMWSSMSSAPELPNYTSKHSLVAYHWMQNDERSLKNHMSTFAVYQNLLQIAIKGQMGSRGVKITQNWLFFTYFWH